MNNRTTPETDAFAIKFKTTCGEKYWVPVDIARKLELERDEAREVLRAVIKTGKRLERERDESREHLKLSVVWQGLRDSQDEVLRLTLENRELRNLKNE